MSAPQNVNQALKALEDARTKGSHSVRVTTDLLEMLLNGHVLLSAAMAEVERRTADEDERKVVSNGET